MTDAELLTRIRTALGLLRQGRVGEASRLARELVAAAPGDFRPRVLLGHVQEAAGEPALETFREAARLAPDDPDALGSLARAELQAGHWQAADQAMARFLERFPSHAPMLCNRGLGRKSAGELEAAVEWFRRAVDADPRFVPAHVNLASMLLELGRFDEAEAAARAGLEQDPNSADLHFNLGAASVRQELPEEALHAFDRARRLGIDSWDLYAGLGTAHAIAGDLDKADAHYREALSRNPEAMEVLHDLVQLRKASPDDDRLPLIEAARSRIDALPEGDRARLHFALGKWHADLGEHPVAFEHIRRANTLRLARHPPDLDAALDRLRRTRALFDRARLERLERIGIADARPIFVLGMARSGTTLAETILSAHPSVGGCGEFHAWPLLVDRLARSRECPFPELIEDMDDEALQSLARAYLERAERRAGPECLRFTDKQLANYQLLGLILGLLPEARVVVCRRDPLDTCLSAFFTDFGSGGFFSNDLGQLGRFYRELHATLDHWRELAPDRFVELQYETLLNDPEATVRSLLAGLGLAWDPACLEFHRSRHHVGSASVAQVRQRLYRTSMARWRPYAQWLGPLFESLDLPPPTDD